MVHGRERREKINGRIQKWAEKPQALPTETVEST